jgi:hypothetical protein
LSYIGRTPVVGNFVKLDAITTSATATYNLLNGGVAYFPQTANNCIVSLNGVIQSPTSAYTISGSTIVFSDALTASDSIDFILVLGDVLSIGTPSDGTITSTKLASGVSGLISWQSVVTASTLTAVAGRGYFIDTTSNACTVTLPASATAGDTIILVDYARKWGTNAVTINQNSLNFQGFSSPSPVYNTSGQSVTLIYSGATQGWIPTVDDDVTNEVPQPYTVDFLVIAGGGGGGTQHGGGGGAGGYRNSYLTETSGGGGSSETSLSFVAGTVYTITVGAGGAGATLPSGVVSGSVGVNSSISGTGITTITSNGGGGGASWDLVGTTGGSGGGDAGPNISSALSGTANQGFAGGVLTGAGGHGGAGGGGASAVGGNGTGTAFNNSTAGAGGNGLASSITGSSVTRGGGGGGGSYTDGATGNGGGTGGGGNGGLNGNSGGTNPTAGTANTGGGGGAAQNNVNAGAAGGKGVVILRIPTANYSGTTTGSPTVTTDGSDKVIVFNDSGSITG